MTDPQKRILRKAHEKEATAPKACTLQLSPQVAAACLVIRKR